ncbi:2-phosphosulfolactate phosphatase [Paenibacillus sp. FSL R7-0331]|uniref:2-phosphosulfolactate phosphatase n=1 Tax=Paenibacillus sp. FSL R7-0331 TaxID=1536773 RepID=UPI0004F7F2D9|nr:2-phosphosulfolactate phosphatase [Paenibacillus sp. FSL R7-0331]AIQ54134.1 2-phosphosulfolactate phosphatase [Paenibacillus sp. FSL R7-0331]
MFFDQAPYDIKLDWGQRGARAAAERGDIIIIVDVLSFSSTVVTAVQHKANIYPYPPPANEQAKAYAKELGAEIIRGRAEAVRTGGHSLSPLTFSSADYERDFVLCSMNGAACTWIAAQAPALLVGCLLNASAVAETANRLRLELRAAITVVPCGEKWPDVIGSENNLRPGIEDYLGAGLILSKLTGSKSAEAEVCIGALRSSGQRIRELIWECTSARELRGRGFEADVTYCCQVDISYAVPVMQHNRFINILPGLTAELNGQAAAPKKN